MTGYIAIFGWPLVAIFFFKRFQFTVAICVTLVAGYLFLPMRPSVDLPVLPKISKESVPAFAAMVLALLGASAAVARAGKKSFQNRFIPRDKLLLLLLVTMFISGIFTAITNDDVLRYGPRILPSLTLYDGLSTALTTGVMLIPFLLGYVYLARPEDHRNILIVVAIFGAIYAVLALYEIRMSPQLNRTFYGFFPHSWVQHKRGGGWRPIVFLEHGLFVGIYLAMATLAAITLFKQTKDAFQQKAKWLALFVGGTLLLSSNLGATLIVFIITPFLLFSPARIQLTAAATVAILVLLYPVARGNDYVPVDGLVNLAAKIDVDRAGSLEFRFENEDILLDKAKERPYFGWGGWTRARVFDQRGQGASTPDGQWVITFGEGGWTRYIGEMGLLCLPVILLAFGRLKNSLGNYTIGLCVVLTANLIDLIPNSGLSPVTWLITGALWGRLSLGQIKEEDQVEDTTESPLSSYTRQTKKIIRKQQPAKRQNQLRTVRPHRRSGLSTRDLS